MKTHQGRVALVTGAAAGIGRSISVGLAQRGATVIGFDLVDPRETGELVQQAGTPWLGLIGDVSSEQDIAQLFAQTERAFGRLDILINNAGIYPITPFDQLTFEQWRKVMSVNFDSQFLTCKQAVPLMQRNQWGRIVNLVSSSVSMTSKGLTAYKASKLGIVGLTRGLAGDLGEFGITVNAVSPSLTDTPGTQEGGLAGQLPKVKDMQAIRKPATPDDVVGAVLFLSGEDSYFVTGQTLYSDGGLGYL